jgi:hypothetical protein
MALLFDTPFPHTQNGQRYHIARLISTARGSGGDYELLAFCRRLGIPRHAVNDGMVHIGGSQIESARYAGAREVSPEHLDKLIRSKTHG